MEPRGQVGVSAKQETPPAAWAFAFASGGVESVRSSTYVDLHGSTVSLNVFPLPVGQVRREVSVLRSPRVAPVFRKDPPFRSAGPSLSPPGRPFGSSSVPSVRMWTPLASSSVGRSLRSPWGSTLAGLTRWLFFPGQDVRATPSLRPSGSVTRSEDLVTFP